MSTQSLKTHLKSLVAEPLQAEARKRRESEKAQEEQAKQEMKQLEKAVRSEEGDATNAILRVDFDAVVEKGDGPHGGTT